MDDSSEKSQMEKNRGNEETKGEKTKGNGQGVTEGSRFAILEEELSGENFRNEGQGYEGIADGNRVSAGHNYKEKNPKKSKNQNQFTKTYSNQMFNQDSTNKNKNLDEWPEWSTSVPQKFSSLPSNISCNPPLRERPTTIDNQENSNPNTQITHVSPTLEPLLPSTNLFQSTLKGNNLEDPIKDPKSPDLLASSCGDDVTLSERMEGLEEGKGEEEERVQMTDMEVA